MKIKAVVTGSRGFVGRYLVDHLKKDKHWKVKHLNLRDGVDIRDFEAVRNYLDIERPDYIFHLAAEAFVPESFANPRRAIEVNTIGSLNILEAVRQLGIKARIHLAGTSEEYGNAKPVENGMISPRSPYAISKAAMDHLGQLYAAAYGMPVVVTRAFNHTGPGRGEMYAEASFAKQIAEIEKGKRSVLEHGNLESVRNYTDVRDMVRAYAEAVMLPAGVYNVCSEVNVSMQQVVDTLSSMSEINIKTKVNPALYRPGDFSFQKPSCDKFSNATGWKPVIPFEQTLLDILNEWRARV